MPLSYNNNDNNNNILHSLPGSPDKLTLTLHTDNILHDRYLKCTSKAVDTREALLS